MAPASAERAPAPVAATPPLQAPIEKVIARWEEVAQRISRGKAGPQNVVVALHVVDPADGSVLASIEADRAMRPASNMKLVTTAAALTLLGADAGFVTPIEASGKIEAGVLQGDLVVRAAGDPFWDPSGHGRVEDRLAEAARALVAKGLRRVTGDLVLEEGRFADPEPAPGWPAESQRWTEYCALASGLTLNAGVLVAEVTSTGDGQAARLEVHPSPTGLDEHYGVTTRQGARLDVRVGATSTAVTVKGTIPFGQGGYLAEFRHPDPPTLFGAVFSRALADAGVRVQGTVVQRHGTPVGQELYELRSPLRDILSPINAESRNGCADQLLIALGQALGTAGSRPGGSAVVARALDRLGVSSAGLVQVDGSGLSRDNRASARQITALLASAMARGGEEASAYRGSLAVMGQRGTLEDRLVGTPAAGRVFAKTGWIAGTSALSGIARTLHGHELVFSILVEYPAALGGLNRDCFKKMQDEIVLLLTETEVGP